jgi:hypothetical protein
MFFWIAKQVIISLVMILLFHQIILFITKTFTKPKVIDLVNKPTEMYEDIYETMKNPSLLPPSDVSTGLPQEEKDDMQNELQDYLNNLTTEKEDNTNINIGNIGDKKNETQSTLNESDIEKS